MRCSRARARLGRAARREAERPAVGVSSERSVGCMCRRFSRRANGLATPHGHRGVALVASRRTRRRSRMLKFTILGPIEVSDGERRLSVGGPRQVALLTFLLVHANQATSTDQLIDAVWGDQDVRGAVKRLQVAITRLRKTLDCGDDAAESRLRTTVGGYVLAVAPGELDADIFEARLQDGRRALEDGEPARAAEVLCAALALWRGPPLAEVAYEAFAQPEIRRLEELRGAATQARLDPGPELGRHGPPLAQLPALVA